jgi:hypothetical protein
MLWSSYTLLFLPFQKIEKKLIPLCKAWAKIILNLKKQEKTSLNKSLKIASKDVLKLNKKKI